MNSHAKNLNLAIVYFHGEFFLSFFTLLLLLMMVIVVVVVVVGTLTGRWSDLFFWSYLADFVLFFCGVQCSAVLQLAWSILDVFLNEWNQHKMKIFNHLDVLYCTLKIVYIHVNGVYVLNLVCLILSAFILFYGDCFHFIIYLEIGSSSSHW